MGRPDTARHDNSIVLGGVLVDDASDIRYPVGHDGDALDVDPAFIESFAEPRGVRVDRVTGQQLVTDRD